MKNEIWKRSENTIKKKRRCHKCKEISVTTQCRLSSHGWCREAALCLCRMTLQGIYIVMQTTRVAPLRDLDSGGGKTLLYACHTKYRSNLWLWPGLLVHNCYGWKLRAILSHTCVSLATHWRHKAIIMLATNLLKRIISRLTIPRSRALTHTLAHMHTVKTARQEECPLMTKSLKRYSASHNTLVVTWDNCPRRPLWGAGKEKSIGARHLKQVWSVTAVQDRWHSCQRHQHDGLDKSCNISFNERSQQNVCLLFQGYHQSVFFFLFLLA